MTFKLPHAATVIRSLAAIVAVMAVMHILVAISLYFTDSNTLGGVRWFFDLDSEKNLPTWFSSINLFVCAMLFGLIGMSRSEDDPDEFRSHWLGLALIFAFLSLDETAMLHERATTRVVLPITLVIGLIYIPFLQSLPREQLRLFIIAGALYVGGAMGMEAIGNNFSMHFAQDSFPYSMLTMIEELLEMAGILTMLYTLLNHAEEMAASRTIILRSSQRNASN